MASLLSPRRTEHDLVLRATTPAEVAAGPAATDPVAPRVGWLVAAAAGGLLCSVTGWLLVAGLTVVGWLAADPGTLVGALAVGTSLWLTAHGVGLELGGLAVTLVPWGVAALTAVLLSRCAGVAVRSARGEQRPRAAAVAGVLLVAYALPVLAAGFLLGRPGLAPGHLLAVLLVLFAAASHGAVRALGHGWTRAWPAWSRALPRAVLASQLVLLTAGAAVLVTGLALHLDRVRILHDALAPGVAGGIALLAAQLALAPNAVVWSASYALGGGFTLGGGSVVAPASTELGVLPGLPLLGALPTSGPGPADALWWLASGAVAGAVAAWLVVRSRPGARFDETSLVGGLAGVLGGLAFVVLAWAASGDLGTVRLSGLGPLLLPLLVMAVTTLGLAGMVTGLSLGLWQRHRRGRTAAAADPSRPEPEPEPVPEREPEPAQATAAAEDEEEDVVEQPDGADATVAEATEVLPRTAPSASSEEGRPAR